MLRIWRRHVYVGRVTRRCDLLKATFPDTSYSIELLRIIEFFSRKLTWAKSQSFLYAFLAFVRKNDSSFVFVASFDLGNEASESPVESAYSWPWPLFSVIARASLRPLSDFLSTSPRKALEKTRRLVLFHSYVTKDTFILRRWHIIKRVESGNGRRFGTLDNPHNEKRNV